MTTATVEENIWQALKARVLILPSPVDFPLAWPMETFTPPTANSFPAPYIDVLDMPNKVNRVLIGSNDPHDRQGILGVHLMYPVALKTAYDVQKQLAAQIAAHFPTDLKLSFNGVTVRIQQAADIMQPLRDDAYIRWPISVRWQSFA